jgi:hypothetical protein
MGHLCEQGSPAIGGPLTKKPRSFHKFALKSSFCAHTDLRSGAMAISGLRAFPVNDIDPEISELLELLNTREQFDEIAQLFEHSLRPWDQYSEEERRWLIAKAASMMSRRPS